MKGTSAEPIYTKKIIKSVSLPCPFKQLDVEMGTDRYFTAHTKRRTNNACFLSSRKVQNFAQGSVLFRKYVL
jgi:hypothetical protein